MFTSPSLSYTKFLHFKKRGHAIFLLFTKVLFASYMVFSVWLSFHAPTVRFQCGLRNNTISMVSLVCYLQCMFSLH